MPVLGGSIFPVVLTAQPFVAAPRVALSPEPLASMPSSPSSDAVRVRVTLSASEATLPPLGLPPQPDRAVGMVTLFLSLENPQLAEQTLEVVSVEIRSCLGGQQLPFEFEPQQIELQPLENAVVDIHLTNQTGFEGQDRVQAIVTYRVGSQTRTLESDAVVVESL